MLQLWVITGSWNDSGSSSELSITDQGYSLHDSSSAPLNRKLSHKLVLEGCFLTGETQASCMWKKSQGEKRYKVGFYCFILNCEQPWRKIIVLKSFSIRFFFFSLFWVDSESAGSRPSSRWASECWQSSQRNVAQFQMSSLKGWPGAHGQVRMSFFPFLFIIDLLHRCIQI